jgi:DNA polymerase III epsilon subunit-like protein
MIVVDIETSGLNPEKNGIWQIGALEFDNPKNTFIDESRIDDEDEITQEALTVTGKSEIYLRNQKKQSQKQLLERFFSWAKKIKIKNCICQNPQFDVSFISAKARKYGLQIPFHYRSFDLHSTAQLRHNQIKGEFLIEEDKSAMDLSNTLKICGMKDERIQLKKGEVTKTGKPHNALEDAKLTAECFSRLIHGKNLLNEFAKFAVPEYLK